MEIKLVVGKSRPDHDVLVLGCFSKKNGEKSVPVFTGWNKEIKEVFSGLKTSESFTGAKGESLQFATFTGETILVVGLGEKSKAKAEVLRRQTGNILKSIKGMKAKVALVDLATFAISTDSSKVVSIVSEALLLANYSFDKYKKAKPETLKEIHLLPAKSIAKNKKELEKSSIVSSGVNFTRDLVNEVPNVLNSEVYAKEIEKDVKKNLKGVRVKVLGKADLKKEKMGLFLSVNNASKYEPRLVHLTYTPSGWNAKKGKHIALVGKGLTFDTGGYSLKPSGSMINMKFDMGGSATVYGAFRNAVQLKSKHKISCFLGMTDNAVSNTATFPDSVVRGRSGKTVEILNTDAEGRLVLADCLSYACDQKPNVLIDAATLTGACLVALGSEVCGLMGNTPALNNKLLKHASSVDEYMWELPIIDEFRNDMKSDIADLKNIGGSRFAGTPKAAAFLEEFVSDDVQWAHLDVAGVADSQGHLSYCPKKGASGLVVRTLTEYLLS